MITLIRSALLVLLTFAWTLVPAAPSPLNNTAYIDTALISARTETVSVIVTGENSTQAAAAVKY